MHIDTDDNEELTLNLAPMIDVVFLLLIFFMVATTFIEREKEMAVDLPTAESGEEVMSPDEIVINLLLDGTIKMNGVVVAQEEFVEALERAARTNSETPVTIRGDKEIPYQRVVTVMDTCLKTGLLDIGLSTLDG